MEPQNKFIEKGNFPLNHPPPWLHDFKGVNFCGSWDESPTNALHLEFTPRVFSRGLDPRSPDLLMKGSRIEEHLQGEDGSQ